MKSGKLYGVGVGPGDPELVTLKAARILRQADVIAVPDKGAGEKTALQIVKELVEGKPLLFCPTPMIRDKAQLDAGYEAVARQLAQQMDEGKTVAFITLGDPSIYSTYLYIHKKVLAMGYEAELVAGVPSFCAAAARLGQTLCEGEQRLLIVPASYDAEDCMDIAANKVFMKAGKGIGRLKEQLADHGLLDRAAMVENCGMPGERVWPKLAQAEETPGYFSVVLVKEGE